MLSLSLVYLLGQYFFQSLALYLYRWSCSLHAIEENLILWRILDVCCHTNDTWHIPNYFGRSCCFIFPYSTIFYHYLLCVYTCKYWTIYVIPSFFHVYIPMKVQKIIKHCVYTQIKWHSDYLRITIKLT